MSADCLFVLRKVAGIEQLRRSVWRIAEINGFGIWFSPKNALLYFNQVVVNNGDLCFAPTDSFDTTNVDLLISHDNYLVNGLCSSLPLRERMLFFQKLTKECLKSAESVEIYISEDDPFLPDYTVHEIKWDNVADTLLMEYQNNTKPVPEIPTVVLFVTKDSV